MVIMISARTKDRSTALDLRTGVDPADVGEHDVSGYLEVGPDDLPDLVAQHLPRLSFLLTDPVQDQIVLHVRLKLVHFLLDVLHHIPHLLNVTGAFLLWKLSD